jgi:hypothetical protein
MLKIHIPNISIICNNSYIIFDIIELDKDYLVSNKEVKLLYRKIYINVLECKLCHKRLYRDFFICFNCIHANRLEYLNGISIPKYIKILKTLDINDILQMIGNKNSYEILKNIFPNSDIPKYIKTIESSMYTNDIEVFKKQLFHNINLRRFEDIRDKILEKVNDIINKCIILLLINNRYHIKYNIKVPKPLILYIMYYY